MFGTLQKSLVMLALISIALGAALAGASAFSATPTLAAGPAGQLLKAPAATPGLPTHRLAAINPQKTRLAAATTAGVMVWALDSGKLLATFDTQGRAVTDLAFAPSSMALAAGLGDGTISVWDAP